ncbi:MAG: flavohemoglobin expression-modulating QEGLA motif protein [Gammaproteobacteria bacterium]|nr:flavohemoglobin expression-modulating QEGLA motif protein [Gammaproteobacteria bacterium]
MSTDKYKAKLKHLSDQLVNLQKPILILDAIKGPNEIQEKFVSRKNLSLPKIDRHYYESITLNFNPVQQKQAFRELKLDVDRDLGKHDKMGEILKNTIDQYIVVIDMLLNRGKKEFLDYSRMLYGSASDHLYGDKKTLIELGERLCHIFSLPATVHLAKPYSKDISAKKAVKTLNTKLQDYFSQEEVCVRISDGIVSDASAGGDGIKVNANAKFSTLDLQVLEVHEGWVHIGTTLNGRRQKWASWLSVGSPRITSTQEGLAVLIETLTFSSYPGRAKRISDRVIAINMAEQGADFIDIYRYFVESGLNESESFVIAQRTFRGGMVNGDACFTKDLSYVRGFVETVNFLKSAILSDIPEVLPMLFVGKVTLEDIPVLYEHMLEGIIEAPKYLPPMFRDLNGLYTWFGFSSGLALIDLVKVQKQFEKEFQLMQ